MAQHDRPRCLGLTWPAWCGVASGLLLLGGLLHVLINLGPRSVPVAVATGGLSAAQWRIVRQVDDIEQRYRRAAKEGMPAPEWEGELSRAIALQGELLRGDLSADQAQLLRLERLEAARDTVRARRVWPRVQALEAQLAGDPKETDRVRAWTELLVLRRDINRSQADARFKDLVRETQIARDLEGAQARPLRAEADAEIERAQAAVARADWPGALAHYSRAGELLADINLRFARTRYADNGLQSRVAAEAEGLQGAEESAQIAVYARGGDAAAAAGECGEADADYGKAIALQTQLNERWPRSRFASTAQLEQWEGRRQTVLADAALAQLRRQDAAVAGLLAQRRTLAAITQMAAIRGALDKLSVEWPKSLHQDEGLARKYVYLATLTGTLRGLQDAVYDRLVPLPGDGRVMLLRTEVPQGLYTQVMKINPSREDGEGRPVESVTWVEAQEFCRRLGWVLGRPVRLPAAAEFERARGAADRANPGLATGPGNIVEADRAGLNANGYRALDGNVAEWLGAPEAAKAAPVAGGPAADLPKDTRSPVLGFRFVVEMGPE
jgi:hypothetical protein